MKIVSLDGYTYRLVNGDFFQLFNTKSFKNFNLPQHDLFDILLSIAENVDKEIIKAVRFAS